MNIPDNEGPLMAITRIKLQRENPPGGIYQTADQNVALSVSKGRYGPLINNKNGWIRVQDPGGGQRLWLLLARMDLNALTGSTCLKRGSTALDLKIYCTRQRIEFIATAKAGVALPPYSSRNFSEGVSPIRIVCSLQNRYVLDD